MHKRGSLKLEKLKIIKMPSDSYLVHFQIYLALNPKKMRR